jgi:hypothetical protein
MNRQLHPHSIRGGAVILTAYLITISISGPLLGQSSPCAEPLKEGVYNHYKARTLAHKYGSMLSYFKSSDFEEDVRHNQWGLGITVPVYGVPVSVAANSSDDKFNQFRKEITKLTEVQLDELLVKIVAKDDPNIDFVEAYFDCVKQGFSYSSELIGERVIFTIRFIPISITNPMPKVTENPVVYNGEDVSVLPKKGKALDIITHISARPKDVHQRVSVEIFTNQAPVYVPGPFPEPATTPIPSVPLSQQIRDGSEFQVVFSSLAKPLGTIHKDMVLHGFYRQRGDLWYVWSAQHPRPNHVFIYGPHGDIEEGPSHPKGKPVSPMDHQLNLWGAIFTFEENGKVYHSSQDKDAIGELTNMLPPPSR